MINPIGHRQQGNFRAQTGQVLFVAIQMDGNITLGAAVMRQPVRRPAMTWVTFCGQPTGYILLL
jgi:hypothetical protein